MENEYTFFKTVKISVQVVLTFPSHLSLEIVRLDMRKADDASEKLELS